MQRLNLIAAIHLEPFHLPIHMGEHAFHPQAAEKLDAVEGMDTIVHQYSPTTLGGIEEPCGTPIPEIVVMDAVLDGDQFAQLA
jgi:hypothetical protein